MSRLPPAPGGVVLLGVVALLAAGVVAAGSAQQADAVRLQELRNEAKARYEEQQYAAAAAGFEAVVERPESTGQDWLNLALAHYQARDDEAALRASDEAAERQPENPGVPYLQGLIAKRNGDFPAAAAALERARRLDPTDPAIRYNLGAVYAQLQRPEAARQEFEVVMAMGFDLALQHYVSALYQHFQLLLRAGRRQEAEPEIELYRAANQRLSQAQRVPDALEQSRWLAARVPEVGLVPPRPETVADLRLAPDQAVGALPATHFAIGDVDGDGRPDLVATGPDGAVWLSGVAGWRRLPLPTPAGPAALGDFDRDGSVDLYVAAAGGDRLYRNRGLGDGEAPFVPVDAAALPAGGAPSAVVWVDADHDGDLDVLVTHGASRDAGPQADRLLRNLGGGAFEDVSVAAGLDGAAVTRGATWGDFDDDNDIDLYLWRPSGNALYTNERGGRFAEVGAVVGAAGPGDTRDAVAEDLDNDGWLDLALATPDGLVILQNRGQGTFRELPAMPLGDDGGLRALDAADWNNDGWLDLLARASGGVRLLVNAGDLAFRPFAPQGFASPTAPAHAAAADVDLDGAVDLLTIADGELVGWRQAGPLGGWLALRLTGIKNNVRGMGSRVEVKAGGAYQMRPLRGAPLHFGVGDADTLDVVRIRWPNGIVQNLIDQPSGQLVEATELERLEGSCPFLYTWDGRRWRFANEVLGVAPLGMPIAEGVIHTPDPDEYVFVPGEHLAARDGFYELRLTEELRETGYVDAVRLIAVDHPAEIEVIPDERFAAPPHPEFRLFLLERPRPVRAADERGRDWTAEVAAVDLDWAKPFEPGPYDGLATPHSLTIELPEVAGGEAPVRLFLSGWVYWAMGSVNLAVDQDPRHEFTPVALEVPDGAGGWRLAIEDIGLPNAKNTTLVVDLTDHLVRSDPRVRLRTTMRVYWDAARYTVGGSWPQGVAPLGDWSGAHGVPHAGRPALAPVTGGATGAAGDPAPGPPLRLQVSAPVGADLRWRGFSRLERSADGFETFDYASLEPTAPWEQHRGFYTRYGPVGELVDVADDRYVVLATGDELAVRFADRLAPPPDGWRRDWLVYLNGWVKDGDLNTIHGDRVAPLPFHGMSGYPYGSGEGYPDGPAHQRFLEEWLTRPARPVNPVLRDWQPVVKP